ncbi:MAG: hypothetical protein ACLQU1_32510 [Bryobacteraceae bacterium]
MLGAGWTPPSDRLTFGAIGVGSQGGGNMRQWMNNDDIRMVAVCDVREQFRQQAKDTVDTRYGDKSCAAYQDFREL